MAKSSITFEELYWMQVQDVDKAGANSGTFGDGMRSHAKKIEQLEGRVPSYYRSQDGRLLQDTLNIQAPPFRNAGGRFDDIGETLKNLSKDLSENQDKLKKVVEEAQQNPFLEWKDQKNGVLAVKEIPPGQQENMTPREKQLYKEAVSKVGPLNARIKAAVEAARSADERAAAKIEGLGPNGEKGKKPTGGGEDGDGGQGGDDKGGSGEKPGEQDGGSGEKPGEQDGGPGEKPGDRPGEDPGTQYPGGEDPGSQYPGGQYPGGEDPESQYPGDDGTGSDEWDPDDDYEGGGLADGGGVGGGLGSAGGGGASVGGGGLGSAGGGAGVAGGGVGGAAGGPGGAIPVGANTAAGRGGIGGIPMGGMMGGHGGGGEGGGSGEHTWLAEDDDPFGTGDAAPPVIGYVPPAPEPETGAKTDRSGSVTSFT